MRAIAKILAFLAVVLFGGALLAPPLWWAGQWGIEVGILPQKLSSFAFNKYFNRAVLIVAIVGLFPFFRWVGIRGIADLGLEPNPRRGADFLAGSLIGVVGLWAAAAILLASDQVAFHSPFRIWRVPEALATALAVATIEEFFFRGALFGALRKELSWQRALVFLAPFFAVVHFLKPDPKIGKLFEVDALSGFRLIPHAFWQFAEPLLVLKGFLTLLAVGVILGVVVVRTRSLYLAMGLHAGWVFALRAFSLTTKRTAPQSIWFGKELIQGVAPLLLLLLSSAVILWYLRRRPAGLDTQG